MIYLLVFSVFFSSAHEELGNLECQNKDITLKISHSDKGYIVTTNKPPAKYKFEHFSVKDEIKNNQVFDAYSISMKGLDLKVFRPETKGLVKKPMATINKQEFKGCKKSK